MQRQGGTAKGAAGVQLAAEQKKAHNASTLVALPVRGCLKSS